MPGRTDIAVWGAEPVPAWAWDAISGSKRAVGAFGGSGAIAAAASHGGCTRFSDIRSFALGTRGMTLLCTGPLADADAAMLAEGREVVITTEPWPASATLGIRMPRIALLPGMCATSPIAHAFEAAAGSGWSHAFFRCDAPRAFGSVLARTADAARMVLMHAGMPDEVSCTISGHGMLRPREGHADAASRACAACDGTLSCLMRFADGRTATVVACAHAAGWTRQAILRGRFGDVAADDSGADGAPARVAAETIASDGALERQHPEALARRTAALVEAICLSGLTRSWEEPARIEDILARSSRFADD